MKGWKRNSGIGWKRLSKDRGWPDVSYFSEIQRACPVGSLPRPRLWNALTHFGRARTRLTNTQLENVWHRNSVCLTHLCWIWRFSMLGCASIQTHIYSMYIYWIYIDLYISFCSFLPLCWHGKLPTYVENHISGGWLHVLMMKWYVVFMLHGTPTNQYESLLGATVPS